MATIDYVVPLLINGDEIIHSSVFDVFTPSTNEVTWKAVSASTDDATKAVEAAQAAFESWSKTKPSTRTQILLKTADILESNIEEYAKYMMTEMGANQGAAQFFVVPLAVAMCRDIASRINNVCGSVPVVAAEGQSAMVWKEPYGVTLGIVAWNAPYVFGIRAAATAIAAGNTTIIKSSEFTPRCLFALGDAFKKAGLPDGVLNILSCRPQDAPQVVNTMIEHPALRHVNFTGSVPTGRKIAKICGGNLKPCLMELGGKNPAIVLEDADLDKAAAECVAGAFLNAGQICMGTDRIFVHESVALNFLAVIKATLEAMSKEGPSAPQNVNSAASKTRLAKLINDPISQGAQLVAGSISQDDSPSTFTPTILTNVSPNSTLYNEEAFGPLVDIRIFSTEDDAIKMANSTPYGLHAAVFTRDLRRGLAMAKRIDAGAVHINSMTVHDEPALPMGGMKNSGWGRFNADEGMDAFLQRKAVTWDD